VQAALLLHLHQQKAAREATLLLRVRQLQKTRLALVQTPLRLMAVVVVVLTAYLTGLVIMEGLEAVELQGFPVVELVVWATHLLHPRPKEMMAQQVMTMESLTD
jgi:hypothetical protein